MSPFLRHIQACNTLPGLEHLHPWRIAGQVVGYVPAGRAAQLAVLPGWQETPQGLALAAADPAATLAASALALGLRPRGELFDVRPSPEGDSLAVLDRGAIPSFGVIGQGVHVNGLVRRADGLHIWVGWRAMTKPVAPGQLDNLIAGGTPAGYSAFECMVKEAEEEASVPAALARTARHVARLSYMMDLPEGIRRDVMQVYDLELPEDFTPTPNDGEVDRFELWPARRLQAHLRAASDVKFNVTLALIDLFLREGLIDPGGAEGLALRQGLHRWA